MPNPIALKFKDYCRGCGKQMPAGTPGMWLGKSGGVKHIVCYLNKRELVEASIEW